MIKHSPSVAVAEEGAPERLEKSIRLYAEIGMSPERTVSQLLIAGHDRAAVRARFPELPDNAFPEVPATRRRERQERSRTSESKVAARREEGAESHLPPTASAILQRVLAKPLLTADPRQTGSSQARSAEATSSPSALTAALTADSSEAGISFQYVPLIQCSFPHADPGELAMFTRRNGWLELTLSTTRRDTGLPYGVPARLLTIYCASEAIRTRSPEIYLGRTVHEFLRRLDVPITRGERGSLRVYANQLLRLIHCAVSIDENIRDARGRAGLHIRQALFAEEARLWWDEESGVGQGSSLVLSSVLYQSILERSAPLSTNAIRQLRKSPMDLDVYAWLAHRLFNLSRPSTITWAQLSGQFGHGYAQIRKFRHFFLDSLKRVQSVYPKAKLKVGDVGIILLPSRPHVSRATLPSAR
jgi:Plasmid encoded RepA protein